MSVSVVTGGSGFIGSNLVRRLASIGHTVRVVDTRKFPGQIPERAQHFAIDIIAPDSLGEAISGADTIYHLAGNSNTTVSVSDPVSDLKCNVEGTIRVLGSARQNRVPRLVYVSSASVYGRPASFPIFETHEKHPIFPYGASKLSGEVYCLAHVASGDAPEVMIARPFCVYGPGENPDIALVEVSRYARWNMNSATIPVIGDAEKKTRDFVHVSDVTTGLIIIAENGSTGEAYNIGSGVETSMKDLIRIITQSCGGAESFTEDLTMLLDTYRLVPDLRRISSLGYSPKVSLENGIAHLAHELSLYGIPDIPKNPTVLHPEHGGEGGIL
jgi:UDP-glucose 4-epimerase